MTAAVASSLRICEKRSDVQYKSLAHFAESLRPLRPNYNWRKERKGPKEAQSSQRMSMEWEAETFDDILLRNEAGPLAQTVRAPDS